MTTPAGNPYGLTQEHEFPERMTKDIAQFWSQREEGFYRSFDKTRIYWCQLTSPAHNKAIVLVNGRIESAWKYQELFFDLFQQGYDIYSFDHRGQGRSQRLIDNVQMGYVGEFNDYVCDLHELLKTFKLEQYEQCFLLGHSMGGAIATRYLQMYPQHPFSAVALTAPMFGVNIPWQLKVIAIPLTYLLTSLSPQPRYAPGHSDYLAKPFSDNPLSHSEIRYQWFRDLYDNDPELKLGGASTRWVWQGLMAAKQCIQLTRQVTIPTLLIQAEHDKIVDNKAQQRFINKLSKTNKNARLSVIPNGYHELLFEADEYRNPTLTQILEHFSAIQ